MQILEFDQSEFSNALSEEHLRLFVERRERVFEPAEFLQRCLSKDELAKHIAGQAAVAYEESFWRGEIRELLSLFVPKLTPEVLGSYVKPLVLEMDKHSLLITTQHRFILYEWSSTA